MILASDFVSYVGKQSVVQENVKQTTLQHGQISIYAMDKTTISFPVIAVLISQQNRIVSRESPQDMSEDDSPAP